MEILLVQTQSKQHVPGIHSCLSLMTLIPASAWQAVGSSLQAYVITHTHTNLYYCLLRLCPPLSLHFNGHFPGEPGLAGV